MLTKLVLEVPVQAISALHKFCEENEVRIISAEFVKEPRTRGTLTDEQRLVIAQRKETDRAQDLADEFHVTPATIYRVWQDLA